jgi:outer membrane protein assembly factor BamA
MIDRSVGRHSFNRIDVDVEQHISWWRGQRLLTVRALAIGTEADRGHEVPFYLQPTLGGSAWLRGFANDRFRDRHVLAMQAEYGWDIWPFLNAVLFYEMGQVAPEWADLFTQGFERDYGFGFRFGSARTVAVRTDIAFGSGEGTRFSTRFSHAF